MLSTPKMHALIEEKEEQQQDAQKQDAQQQDAKKPQGSAVQSPAVGYFSSAPHKGTILTGGAFIGRLKILNTYYDLHLPHEDAQGRPVRGRVNIGEGLDYVLPVQYGEELFGLEPVGNVAAEAETAAGDETGAQTGAAEKGFVVRAFTTGIFYARPSPDAPPFVTPGQDIEKGKALGLIEVMKTFNHIVFSGTGKSDTGTIKKVYVKDAQEVKPGQPLFLVV